MFSINSELTGKIKRILANTNTTLYIGLLAIYFVLLHKYSEQEDITVGIPSAGRNHADIEKVIGVFINTLAIRNYPKGDKTFGQFLDEVKESALGAYQNENYPFEYLVEQLNIPRDFSRSPVLDVLFVSTTVDAPELEIEGLTFSPYQFSHRTTHLDLVLYMVEKKDTIDMLLEYSSVLFKSSSAEQMTQRYIEILRQVVENKEIKLEDIEISLQLSNAASDKNFDDYTSFDF